MRSHEELVFRFTVVGDRLLVLVAAATGAVFQVTVFSDQVLLVTAKTGISGG